MGVHTEKALLLQMIRDGKDMSIIVEQIDTLAESAVSDYRFEVENRDAIERGKSLTNGLS
jgi:hypothetical protein